MTLDEIAHAMSETRESLSDPIIGKGEHTEVHIQKRRRFIHRAYSDGHGPEAIGAYIYRSQITVMHALRICAMDNHGGEYGRTEAELKLTMRDAA